VSIAATLTLMLAIAAPHQPADNPSDRSAFLRRRGLEHGYNLDYPEALAAFQQAITLGPDDGTAHRLAAATIWMQLLFEQGAVTVEDYLGKAQAHIQRKAPSPDLAAAFRLHINRAEVRAARRVREHPDDADAHFELGAVAGLRASYIATIEGRVVNSVGSARRAFNAHKRALSLDASRRDAGLIVGLYRYGVSSLPLPLRLMARIAGFSSGHESGLRLVEDAARYPAYSQTNARFTLILLYNREGRHLDALRGIRELQQRYPRNRLLWLEAAGTGLRAGRPAEALDAIEEGLERLAADPRPRASGEEARWQSLRDNALAALHRGHDDPKKMVPPHRRRYRKHCIAARRIAGDIGCRAAADTRVAGRVVPFGHPQPGLSLGPSRSEADPRSR
jgi:tetratricopeptide (TPR) repeat protein